MFWIVLIIIFAVIAACLDTLLGKIVAGAATVAIGLLLLSWITGIGFMISLAKMCAVVIVIAVVGAMLIAIIG